MNEIDEKIEELDKKLKGLNKFKLMLDNMIIGSRGTYGVLDKCPKCGSDNMGLWRTQGGMEKQWDECNDCGWNTYYDFEDAEEMRNNGKKTL